MQVRAWLELMRLSNLPTVWSNLLHGLAAGTFVAWSQIPPGLRPGPLPTSVGFYFDQGFVLLIGVSLIYIAGMIFNDVADANEDLRDRPTRAIPSGRVNRRAAAVAATVAAAVGITCSTAFHEPLVLQGTIALVACAAAYDLLPHRSLTGLVLLPTCRVLAFAIGAVAFAGSARIESIFTLHLGLPALLLAGWTLAITLTARAEVKHHGRPRLVGWMIAGFGLIDAAGLFWIGMPQLATACVALGILTVVGQRWIPGS